MSDVNPHNDPAVALSTTDRQFSRALEPYGYSPREIAFIALATVHSGFFLRRQWAKFAGTMNGRGTSEFLAVLLARGHVQALPFGRRDTVYYIGSRTIYGSLGRNPRYVNPFTITRKLMALDVVLALPDRVWCGTEQEKVALCTTQFGVDEALLPARASHSRRDPKTRPIHYFPECWPIAVAGSTVTFTYISHAERSAYPFRRFLIAYAPLMSRLPAAAVLYVSGGGNWGGMAKNVFARYYGTAEQGPVPAGLAAHFKARRLFETGRIGDLSADDLNQLRADLTRFRGRACDRLYHLWQSNDEASSRKPVPVLETYHVPFTYPVAASVEHPALTQPAATRRSPLESPESEG